MFVLSITFVVFIGYVPYIKCATIQTTRTTIGMPVENGAAPAAVITIVQNTQTATTGAQTANPVNGNTQKSATADSKKTPVKEVRQLDTYSTVSHNVKVKELTANDETIRQVTEKTAKADYATQTQCTATGTAATEGHVYGATFVPVVVA